METKQIFDRMAHKYDSDERQVISKRIAEEIRADLRGASYKTAMEYGCGTGLVGLLLIDLFDNMLFVDTSSGMIEQIERKINEQHIKNASALCCDFCESMPDVKADVIFLTQVLLHVKQHELLLERLFEALNPGGRLIVVDFDKNDQIDSPLVHNGFEQEALIKLLAGIGFVDAKAHTFYYGEKMFMNQDASLFLLGASK